MTTQSDLDDIGLLNRAPKAIAQGLVRAIQATSLSWKDIAAVARHRFDMSKPPYSTKKGAKPMRKKLIALSVAAEKPVLLLGSGSKKEVLVFVGDSKEVLKSIQSLSDRLWLARRLAELEGR